MSESLELLDLYSEKANEETSTFNRKQSWNPEDTLDEKYLELLQPHSSRYFSRLRPMFSFEVKTLESLNLFSHVLFKDGVFPLLKFFHRFPTPGRLRTKVLVSINLCALVPDEWQEHVYYYELSFLKRKNEGKKALLVLNAMSFFVDEKSLENDLSRIKKNLDAYEEYFVLPLYNVGRGEDYLHRDRSYVFDLFSILKEGLPSLKSIALSAALAQIDENWNYHLFNPYRYYVEDCSLSHEMIRRRARPILNGEELSNTGQRYQLSPEHGMNIYAKPLKLRQTELEVKKYIYETIEFPKGRIFSGEPNEARGEDDFFKSFYSTANFRKFSQNVGRRLSLDDKK